jgi:hypothetical protein
MKTKIMIDDHSNRIDVSFEWEQYPDDPGDIRRVAFKFTLEEAEKLYRQLKGAVKQCKYGRII